MRAIGPTRPMPAPHSVRPWSRRWAPIRVGLAIVAIAGLLVMPGETRAQIHIGPQIGIGSDSGVGLGGRVLFPLRLGLELLDGTVDATYFLGGDVDSWIDTNLNVRIGFPLSPDFSTRLGAGLNASFVSLDTPGTPSTDTETELGFNLLAGFEYPYGGVMGGRAVPFGELRVVLGGHEQVVFTLGLTFGPGGP